MHRRAHSHLLVIPGIALFTCGLTLVAASTKAAGQGPAIRIEMNGEIMDGQALAWTGREIQLLGRDGWLRRFSPDSIKRFDKLPNFRSYSQSELRGQLQREFGRAFQVSGTGHYLVVHPAGQRDQWAPRFEELYRSFMHYFTARGLRPQKPEFPLVAVVLPTRRAFEAYARQSGSSVSANTLGYYSPTTNRISLYDITAGRKASDWYQNAETIIHEATHQTAFNTGVHDRFAPPPRWVGEGLGTMFEARGVWDAPHYTNQKSRVNTYQLQAFRDYLKRRPKGSLAQFVSNDRMFQTNPGSAYAEAWALSFYLAETQHGRYASYLRRTTEKPAFQMVPPTERLADFTDIFGTNLAVFEAHFLRYMKNL